MNVAVARYAALAAAWCFAAPGAPRAAGAQGSDTRIVTPNDGGIDGRRIPAYTNAWQTYQVGADDSRKPAAVWYDTVSVLRREGKEILRRVQWIVRPDGVRSVLVNEAERATLIPLLTTAAIGDSPPFIHLRFEGRRVSGHRTILPMNAGPADQVPVDFTLELPQPVFDWRWWGLLAAAQPLSAGYESRFLTFAAEPNIESFLLWITMRVVGEDSVGRIPCWIVDLDAGVPWRLWISKSQDVPPVQRIRIHQANGNVVMWEPLELSQPAASPIR